MDEPRSPEPAREVDVQIDAPEKATADPRLLRVVLTNLLLNSWQFTRDRRPGAHLLRPGGAQQRRSAFFVRDDGGVFEPKYSGKLFARSTVCTPRTNSRGPASASRRCSGSSGVTAAACGPKSELILILPALVSCGPGKTEVKVAMDEYSFEPCDVTVAAGQVDFLLTNNGKESHDLSIAELTGPLVAKSDLVPSGGSTVLSVKFKTGKYFLYCGVALHRDRGMEGTLTVR